MKKSHFILVLFLLIGFNTIAQESNLKNSIFNGLYFTPVDSIDNSIIYVRSVGSDLRIISKEGSKIYHTIKPPSIKIINGKKYIIYTIKRGKIKINKKELIISIDNKDTIYTN